MANARRMRILLRRPLLLAKALLINTRKLSVCGLIIGWVFTQPMLFAEQAKSEGHNHPKPQVLAPGYADLEFTPPEVGAYKLPPMGFAGDGAVLDTSGKPVSLDQFLGVNAVVVKQ